MTRGRFASVVFLAVAGLTLVAARPRSQELGQALQRWCDAVDSHTPGRSDPALATVWTLTFDDRKFIADHLRRLLDAWGHDDQKRSDTDRDATFQLASRLSAKMTPAMFLERAAILHLDAVLFEHPSQQASDLPSFSSAEGVRATVVSKAEQQRGSPSFGTAKDGEVVGSEAANWNWPFARALLDLLPPGETSFIPLWYHATAAYMFRNRDFGELGDHLARAAKLVPNDPRVLFDIGCMDEALASDLFQQISVDDRAEQAFNQPAPFKTVVRRSFELPSPASLEARAEASFRRAIAGDPRLGEARVRLARLLEKRGDPVQAIEQVRMALGGAPAADVAFYAHLFGARAANALGELDEAEAQVTAAMTLFPKADSALLEASVTALHRSDASAAFARLRGLETLPRASQTAQDPWRDYPWGIGRIYMEPIRELWSSVSSAPAPTATAVASVQQPSLDLIPRLQRWSASVLNHRPGVIDDAIRATWALDSDDRTHLEKQLPLLVAAFGPTPPKQHSQELAQIVVLGGELVDRISAVDFLERAAILHADAAMFDQRTDEVRTTGSPVMSMVPPRGRSTLRAGTDQEPTITTTRDGEVKSLVRSNPNWEFARFVLDQIPTGRAITFVGLWYHATAAFLFKNGRFAEVDWHLAHAATVLPADSRILFDRGALAEVLSMNLMQEASRDSASQKPPSGAALFAPATLPASQQLQADAIRYYQHAVQIYPRLAEAHVRLAHLLGAKSRDQDACDEIRFVLDETRENDILFYAHMFGVRCAAALGRFQEADAHAAAALALFPNAQSARLAASQLALRRGQEDHARTLVAQLGDWDTASTSSTDPWTLYPYGPGRDAERLLAQLWGLTPLVH